MNEAEYRKTSNTGVTVNVPFKFGDRAYIVKRRQDKYDVSEGPITDIFFTRPDMKLAVHLERRGSGIIGDKVFLDPIEAISLRDKLNKDLSKASKQNNEFNDTKFRMKGRNLK